MKRQLPADHTLTLVAHELNVPGEAQRGIEPLHGESFELVVGTLTLMGPARLAHTAILCLAGEIEFTGGSLVTGDGAHRQLFGSGTWRLGVVNTVHSSPLTVDEYLNECGSLHRQVGQRLGLDRFGQRPVNTLDRAVGVLLGLAVAATQDPDVVGLDLWNAELSLTQLETVLEALREFVDVQGRTVLLGGDLNAFPVDLQATFDQVVELGHSLPGCEPAGC